MRIETERLLLRRLSLDDADEYLSLQTEPEVARWFGPLDRQQVIERLRADQRHWAEHGYGLLGMIDRRTGRFVGRVGLRYWPQFEETEVGWVLRPEVWGRGFATEAARACVQWGFRLLAVPYLTALIEPSNARSIRVAERLGMTPLRRDFAFDRNLVVYAVGRDQSVPA